MPYQDNSYAPIGTHLQYKRGDGCTVTLQVTRDGVTAPPVTTVAQPVAAATPPDKPSKPRLAFDIFGDGPGLPIVPVPAIPLSVPNLPQLSPTATLKAAPAVPEHIVGPTDDAIFDNPHIGGKFTLFVLLYGPAKFHEMHKRCLTAILTTVMPNRLDLRVGSNELCGESATFVDNLVARGVVSKHYRHLGNDRKYPVMREMFYDPTHPITTRWLIWFDDDTIADRTTEWLKVLAHAMVANPDAAMIGPKFTWAMDPGQANFMRRRPWYRGKQFRNKSGQPTPNGNVIHFATGSCWALQTEAMRACDIPDTQLGHNGGDYTIGEQLYQGGFQLKSWNGKKQYVNWSSVKRRGLTEQHFGSSRTA